MLILQHHVYYTVIMHNTTLKYHDAIIKGVETQNVVILGLFNNKHIIIIESRVISHSMTFIITKMTPYHV